MHIVQQHNSSTDSSVTLSLFPHNVGAALAIAIALHNIPEGICVSMPIYYATGNKLKGFFSAFLSRVSEPIGRYCTHLNCDEFQ